jgi:hypothetical protein
MPNAELRVIPARGALAGGGVNPVDLNFKFIDDNLKELLAS